MKNFTQGQTIRVNVTFRDFNGGLADPSVVSFLFQNEVDDDGSTFEVYASSDLGTTIVSTGPGKYHFDWNTDDKQGVWLWRVTGSGSSDSALQGKLYLDPAAPIAP